MGAESALPDPLAGGEGAHCLSPITPPLLHSTALLALLHLLRDKIQSTPLSSPSVVTARTGQTDVTGLTTTAAFAAGSYLRKTGAFLYAFLPCTDLSCFTLYLLSQ